MSIKKQPESGDPGGNRTRDNLIKSQVFQGLIIPKKTTAYILVNVLLKSQTILRLANLSAELPLLNSTPLNAYREA